jgi:lipopolysaccharide transport system ATP-binding protein
MDGVTRLGRTVLFVSHNLAAVTRLCPRALLLDSGRVVSYGKSQQVVDEYMVGIDGVSKLQLRTRSDRFGTQAVRFVGIELRDTDGTPIPQAAAGQDVVLAIEYESEPGAPLHDVEIGIYVRGPFEERICTFSTTVTGADLFREIPPHGIVLCEIPRLPLQPGRYSTSLTCHVAGEIADAIDAACVLDVEVGHFFKSGRLPASETGLMLVDHAWQLAARNGAGPGGPAACIDRTPCPPPPCTACASSTSPPPSPVLTAPASSPISVRASSRSSPPTATSCARDRPCATGRAAISGS